MKTRNFYFILCLIGSLVVLDGCDGQSQPITKTMKGGGGETKTGAPSLAPGAAPPDLGSQGEPTEAEGGTATDQGAPAEGEQGQGTSIGTEETRSGQDIQLGAVEHQPAELEMTQKAVDQGQQPWRLDPYEVAKSEGISLGFTANDSFKLLSKKAMGEYSGTGEAEVEAVHNGVTYIIQLIQPLGPGQNSIWAINSVRKSE